MQESLKGREEPWLIEARAIVADLSARSAPIYWIDFLLSVSLAWLIAGIYFIVPLASALGLLALVMASTLFFRAGVFMHELVHMPPGQMVWFGRIWNTLQGIPLLMPWILYRNHVDHHSAQRFGSPDDGEYLPLARSPLREVLKYLVQVPLLPLFMLVRFGLLGPLSWWHDGFREWVLTHVSAAVSNPYYRKRFPSHEERHLLIVEMACFAWLVTIALAATSGLVTPPQLGKAYLLLACALGMNWLRNLVAHRYDNSGEPMSHLDQFYHSINITGGGLITRMLFPTGMRYHALHHLFPSIPYHHLPEAHHRLSRQLPADSPYHTTGRASFGVAIAELLRTAWRTPPSQSAMPNWHSSRKFVEGPLKG
ncbi:MAG TPA: fatty acid desaturase [Vicinamibacterales bacterium]|nr:fatty acid desaturase [Vicinamibacterales bacterium]